MSALARREASGLPESARAWSSDITDSARVRATLDDIVAASGPINHLVITQRYRGDLDDWTGEFATTLTASRTILDHVAGAFAEGDRSVAIVSSLIGRFVVSNQPLSYHVGKAGLEALIRHYAVSFGGRGIRVNGVAPCTVVKREARGYYGARPALVSMFEDIIPLGRMGTADDVAGVVGFLCDPASSFMTGQVLTVDGGMSLVLQETIARRLTGNERA